MLSKIIKIIIIIILLVALVYAGTCAYFNFFARQDIGEFKMPNIGKAAYSVHIKNTGNLILTDNFEQLSGELPGGRVFILHGYWELVEQKFMYRKSDIILDEQVFGEITIRRR